MRSAPTAVPPRPVRVGEQLAYKLGRRCCPGALARRQLNSRFGGCFDGHRALGPDERDGPRVLVRVDEFPHYQAWDEPERFGTPKFERFHEIMSGAGVPYLLAVLPRVSREPLAPGGSDSRPLADDEVATLRRIGAEGVSFALHGRDHRARFVSPRRHSELCGLDRAQTERLLDGALAELARYGIEPRVFVPPYNRFDAGQWDPLASRFEIVCGGPESIGLMGFQRTPQRRGDTVYLPSYAPFYGQAAEVLPAIARAIEHARGLWVPVVLHWGWEAEAGWDELERLAELVAPYAVSWEGFARA